MRWKALVGGLALALWTGIAAAATLVTLPQQLVVDVNGTPRSGAKLFVYDAGTTTPHDAFTTSALSVAHASPIVAVSTGLFPSVYVDADDGDFKLVLKDSADVTIWTEDNIPATVGLVQSQVGEALYPRTAGEIAAGVTPTDYVCPPGTPCRYGIGTDGTTNYTNALADMFEVGGTGQALDFGANLTIVTDAFTINSTNNNIPPYIDGRNITFKARTGCAAPLVTIENPHTDFEGFQWRGSFTFDANDICPSALLIHGSQRAYYGRFRAIKSTTGPQIRVEGEANFGVYSNVFDHWQAGGVVAEGGNDDGFSCKSVGGTNNVAANQWNQPTALRNIVHGFDLDDCNDTFIAPRSERNDGDCWAIDDALTVNIIGGYSENCNVSMADDGADDLTGDIAFRLTANSNHVMIFGGSHVGSIEDEELGDDHTLHPGRGQGLNVSLTGLGLGGANPVNNGINFLNSSDVQIQASGSTKLRWVSATDHNRSHVALLVPQVFHTQDNVASATNITYVSTSDVWRITGTTTINTITAPGVGNPIVYLICTANTTINDDSTAAGNIILAGGANLACTADDTLSLVWNSTDSKWVQLGAVAVN